MGQEPVSVSYPDCSRCRRKHYLLHSIRSQQRQVCCGGMAGIQLDLTAAGGQQGPGQSAMLGTLQLLPAPASRQPPLSQRQGWVSGVCQGDPCNLRGGWLEHSSTSSDVGFTTSPLPTPAPRRPAFSLATGPFGRKETGPAKAKDSGAPPSERLLRQWLCPVPYHPWGEAVWPEDWNLNAIVFDIVTFPLGRVNPPSRSFAPSHVCQLPPVLAFFHTPAGEC